MADKSAKPSFAPLQPAPWPDQPWQKLGMDIIGPLHDVPQNARFVISLIDYHSKWPDICYMHNVTSEVIVEFLPFSTKQVFQMQ